MNRHIFREYDIRALADEELTDEFVFTIGRAFGTYLINLGAKQAVIGKDNRLSSERIAQAVVRGVLSTGCDVIDIGDTTTPILCFAIGYLRVPGGVMVTGSHNPPQFNGIKFQVGDRPLYGKALEELAQIIESNHFAQGSGSYTKGDILPNYLDLIKKRMHLKRPLQVVVDCGNGNTGSIAPALFQELGCLVIPLYCDSDGRFPNHHPDPAVHANLKDLIREVKRTKSDLGIAYDGDGNRIGVVDETGNIISPDILLGLLAREILSQRGSVKVVCEVKASQALIEDVEKRGGVVVMSRVGYPFVLDAMFTENAALAGELTGHICYNEDYFAYGDAIYTSCHLLELLANVPQPLSELLADFPIYFSTPELRIPCSDDRRFAVVEAIKGSFAGKYNVIAIDGVRVLFENHSWALIRASNTESVLSVRLEAKTAADLEYLRLFLSLELQKLGIKQDSL